MILEVTVFLIFRVGFLSAGNPNFFRDGLPSAECKAVFPAVIVVNWNPIMNAIAMGGYMSRYGHNKVCDSNIVGVGGFSYRNHSYSKIRFLSHQCRGATLFQINLLIGSVKIGDMGRVTVSLKTLEVVALLKGFCHICLLAG